LKETGATGNIDVMDVVGALEVAASAELDVASLYAEHAPFIGRVIQRLSGQGAHVDDLLQETFVVAFRKRAEYRGLAATRTWLYAIASRLCLRHNRGARRFSFFRSRYAQEPARAAPDPGRELEREETIALVYQVLEGLPFKQRETFVLYELEGLEGEQIAEMLAIPIGTVWTRLHHARKKFEALMRRRLARERTVS
jgi:RNA polymerase sigma-70 factor (ECF subfamily)